MSAWITVYCTRSVADVTAASLRAALDAADLYTVAEGFGIEDEDVVDDALSQLRIEPASGDEGVLFQLHYGGGADAPPVLIWVWDRSHADEALDEFADTREPGASRVRTTLAQTVEVIGLSLKVKHQDDMGVVLAGQIAEAFASAGCGLIHDQNDDWWAIEDGVPVVVLRRAGDA